MSTALLYYAERNQNDIYEIFCTVNNAGEKRSSSYKTL